MSSPVVLGWLFTFCLSPPLCVKWSRSRVSPLSEREPLDPAVLSRLKALRSRDDRGLEHCSAAARCLCQGKLRAIRCLFQSFSTWEEGTRLPRETLDLKHLETAFILYWLFICLLNLDRNKTTAALNWTCPLSLKDFIYSGALDISDKEWYVYYIYCLGFITGFSQYCRFINDLEMIIFLQIWLSPAKIN